MPARGIYLVGSVPLATSAEVFERISAAFGPRVARIPDGEVGERIDWVTHLERLFRDGPAFEPSDEVFGVHAGATKRRRYRLKAGKTPADVTFGNLGYADNARASYAEFARLRNAGRIHPGTRFQVDLVPAHSVLWLFVVEDQQPVLDAVYNAAVLRELDAITAAIPHRDLAVQFDIASAVFARLERGEPTVYGRTKEEMLERFSTIVGGLADRVPAGVELLFHFCYGDANHRHAIEPTDMGDMVEMANRLAAKGREADRADPYAGAARSLGRGVLRAVAQPWARCGNHAGARARPLHRRHRGHQAPHGYGPPIRHGLCGRHRVRFRPACAGDHS